LVSIELPLGVIKRDPGLLDAAVGLQPSQDFPLSSCRRETPRIANRQRRHANDRGGFLGQGLAIRSQSAAPIQRLARALTEGATVALRKLAQVAEAEPQGGICDTRRRFAVGQESFAHRVQP